MNRQMLGESSATVGVAGGNGGRFITNTSKEKVSSGVSLFYAPQECYSKLMLIAAAELSSLSKIILIDNMFHLNATFRDVFSKKDAKLLRRQLIVSKPYDLYQLREVVRSLPRVLEQHDSCVILLSSLKSLCVGVKESPKIEQLLVRLLVALSHLAAVKKVTVLLFEHEEYGWDSVIDPLLEEHVDQVVRY